MMKDKLYSIALHDLRVSAEDAVETLESVRLYFNRPITVHLVCDRGLGSNRKLSSYIKKKTGDGSLEVVYHGVSHKCEKKGWRMLYWYHHYEAEYIIDSEHLRTETIKGFNDLSSLLNGHPGICPPCWIASGKNTRFLDSLNPLYREKLLHFVSSGKKRFSTVISLGSPRRSDLLFLRAIAIALTHLSVFCNIRRVRIAVHICDLSIPSSMLLFRDSSEKLERNGYTAMLQRKLI